MNWRMLWGLGRGGGGQVGVADVAAGLGGVGEGLGRGVLLMEGGGGGNLLE